MIMSTPFCATSLRVNGPFLRSMVGCNPSFEERCPNGPTDIWPFQTSTAYVGTICSTSVCHRKLVENGARLEFGLIQWNKQTDQKRQKNYYFTQCVVRLENYSPILTRAGACRPALGWHRSHVSAQHGPWIVPLASGGCGDGQMLELLFFKGVKIGFVPTNG